MRHPRTRGNLLLLLAVILAACAPLESQLSSITEHNGLQRQTLNGLAFRHLLLTNVAITHDAITHDVHQLHVYIEGDGLPWKTPWTVNIDPTPRDPLALRLMVQDPLPSIYLGRPCYFELVHDVGCTPLLWTHRRYSVEIVDSMVAALHNYIKAMPELQVTLIGYSGGGVLAMLMASRVPEATQVVTVAANLAVQQWAEWHDYSALLGSLDPAQQAPLPQTITQRHLVGEEDRNVPLRLIRLVTDQQVPASTQVIVKPGFDHRCCWVAAWPVILQEALIATQN